MRTYLILKEKAKRWNVDAEIQGLLAEITAEDKSLTPLFGKYDKKKADGLKKLKFNRAALGARELNYERLDQLTVEVLLGIR